MRAEETFESDTDNPRVLVPALKYQSRELAEKLGKERLVARTVLRCNGMASADTGGICRLGGPNPGEPL